MSVDLTALAHPSDPEFGYLSGQMRPSQVALLEAYAAESETSLDLFPTLDVPYGPHPRQTFDIYRSPLPYRGTLAYYHAGYWQSRDKAPFRFLAPAFLGRGIDVALVNYPLCPDVSMRDLVGAVQASVEAILAEADAAGRGGSTLVAAGHSAGGHLAVELALIDWAAHGLQRHPIAGIVPISGVYELEPLRATRLNDALRLDEAEARAMSPLHRVGASSLPPAFFLVGGLETPAFQMQTEAMADAWHDAGGIASRQVAPGADHFSVLRELAASGSAFDPILQLFD